MSVTGLRRKGMNWPEAIGTATGLTVGFANAFALLGPATASAPIMMRTLAIVLSLIVVGQRIDAREFDSVFAAAVVLAVLVIGTTVVVY